MKPYRQARRRSGAVDEPAVVLAGRYLVVGDAHRGDVDVPMRVASRRVGEQEEGLGEPLADHGHLTLLKGDFATRVEQPSERGDRRSLKSGLKGAVARVANGNLNSDPLRWAHLAPVASNDRLPIASPRERPGTWPATAQVPRRPDVLARAAARPRVANHANVC